MDFFSIEHRFLSISGEALGIASWFWSPWIADNFANFLWKISCLDWCPDKGTGRSIIFTIRGCVWLLSCGSSRLLIVDKNCIGKSIKHWTMGGNQFWVDQYGIIMIPNACFLMALEISFPIKLNGGKAKFC